jgi:hypothetical protein
MNFYSLNNDLINILKSYSSIKVIINTEYYENLNIKKFINNINNEINFYILEYNIININYYKLNNLNINYYFVPLCYNIYLEEYYNNNIIQKKKFNEKDIDILFFGSINSRRDNILNIFKNKYKITIVSSKSGENANKEICNLIERSKIVLNIIFYESNIIFDYYRNSLILASRTLLITEKSKNVNYDIEDGLHNLENNIINVEYNDIIDTIDKYIHINEDEYNICVSKQYEAFKNYKMDNKIINLFNKLI